MKEDFVEVEGLTYVRLDYVVKAIVLAERFQMENHGDLSN
jgi:hypothetical protein